MSLYKNTIKKTMSYTPKVFDSNHRQITITISVVSNCNINDNSIARINDITDSITIDDFYNPIEEESLTRQQKEDRHDIFKIKESIESCESIINDHYVIYSNLTSSDIEKKIKGQHFLIELLKEQLNNEHPNLNKAYESFFKSSNS
jgi:hypothetical protein